MTASVLPERPYATLAPYFATLFEPRGIRDWFSAAQTLVRAAGIHAGRVLDVGAGTCRYSKYWARAGFKTICLDMAPEMLLKARLTGTRERLARVCGTIDCLRPSARFDLATAIDDVTAYLGAQPGGLATFLERLAVHVRSGGILLMDFITPEGRDRYTFRSSRKTAAGRITAVSRGLFDRHERILSVELTLESSVRTLREEHRLRLYSPNEISVLLDGAGFDVLTVTDLYAYPAMRYEVGQASYDILARRR